MGRGECAEREDMERKFLAFDGKERIFGVWECEYGVFGGIDIVLGTIVTDNGYGGSNG